MKGRRAADAVLSLRIEKAEHWKDHGPIFPSVLGTPLCQRNVVRSFNAVLRWSTFIGTAVRPPHTCATLLLSRNTHPKYVQELLGYASKANTLDTYSHVTPSMDGGAASRWRKRRNRLSPALVYYLL
jgi:integrase